MSYGNKGVINEVVNSLASGQYGNDAEGRGSSAAADALGSKLFGSTAESEYSNTQGSASDANNQPIATGRRSQRPDGMDPFHTSAESYGSNDQSNQQA